jgi:AAA15 family ATPase/GTPase
MIKTLEVKNFKSIKDLKLNCKGINIFIGEPNTGKSNILETVGIFSFGYYGGHPYSAPLRNFVRFERVSNLFYDENVEDTVEIKFDDKALELAFKNGYFQGKCYEPR